MLWVVALACNEAPTAATISLGPELPVTTDALEAKVLSQGVDPDGDTVTYQFSWTRDGEAVPELDGLLDVAAEATAKGEVWAVTVTTTDGTLDGPPGSASVTIGNVGPVLATLSTVPELPLPDEDVVATATGTDIDGDALTFHYTWVLADMVVEGPTLAADLTERGQLWQLTATPDDGVAQGDAMSLAVEIDPDHPLVPEAYIDAWDVENALCSGTRAHVYRFAEGSADAAGNLVMTEKWYWFYGNSDWAGDCVDTFEISGAYTSFDYGDFYCDGCEEGYELTRELVEDNCSYADYHDVFSWDEPAPGGAYGAIVLFDTLTAGGAAYADNRMLVVQGTEKESGSYAINTNFATGHIQPETDLFGYPAGYDWVAEDCLEK